MLEFNKLERKIAERLGNFAVTPCVGVWIEILKRVWPLLLLHVTPCVGVWIEIQLQNIIVFRNLCHSLCGSVD